MRIVIFTHPEFLKLKSMQRFSRMLAEGMLARGHQVDVWSPKAFFYAFPVSGAFKKWLGYLDQYVIFPIHVRMRLWRLGIDTLCVFSDQALGPWIWLTGGRPVVVHCHDFLAQRSALGKIPGVRLGPAGRMYQKYIAKGYRRASNFISVSEKTKTDLRLFLDKEPILSEVIYNGLDPKFQPIPTHQARSFIGKELRQELSNGYFLHIGTNYWYKNRIGVLAAYDHWSRLYGHKLPLIMVGEPLSQPLLKLLNASEYKDNIYVVSSISDQKLQMAYAGATALLFPSVDEGFGWPIAEAMACGTLVVTTDKAPMNEVAGGAGFMVSPYPDAEEDKFPWQDEVARMMNQVFSLSIAERNLFIERGIANARRFELSKTLDEIERIYARLL